MRLTVLQRHVVKLCRNLDHDGAVDRLGQAAAERQHAVIRPDDGVLVAHDFQHIVAELARAAGREGHDRHFAANVNQGADVQGRDRLVQDAEEIGIDRLGVHDAHGVLALLVDGKMHLRFVRGFALPGDDIAGEVEYEHIVGRQLVVGVVVRRHEDVPARWIAQAEVALGQRHQADAGDQGGTLDEFLF